MAAVVTPSRAEVMATFAALVPARPDEAFAAVELCGGGGGDLAAHLLGAVSGMRYLLVVCSLAVHHLDANGKRQR